MTSKNQLPTQVVEIMKGLNTTIPSQLFMTMQTISQNKASFNRQQELKMIQQARIKQVKSISTLSRKKSTDIKMSWEDPEESEYHIENKSNKKKKISKRSRIVRLMSQQLPETLLQEEVEQLYPLSPQMSNPEPNLMGDMQQINLDLYFQTNERNPMQNWFQQQKYLNENFF